MSLLEYFFPKFPPLAKDPIPNIKMIKTIRHVTIAKIKKIEDINFSSFKIELRIIRF